MLAYKKGRLLILGTALSWSFAAAFDKGAIAESTPLTHLVLLLTATWSLLSLFKLLRRSKKDDGINSLKVSKAAFGSHQLWLTSVIMLTSFALQLAAYTQWDVAYVESIKRAIGLICSVIFGALIFQEGDPRRRLPAVITMGVGSTCVILGE